MVDLVKIRKKAKKGKDAAPEPPVEETSGTNTTDGTDGSHPAPQSPESHLSHESHSSHQEAPAPAAAPTAEQTSKLDRFKATAGQRRHAVIAQQEADQEQPLELLTFVIAGEHYAVDIEHIVEIVTPRPVTRIPNADETVMGIISLRGTIVTLVDVRRQLRHKPAAETPDARVVVIERGTETVGFAVDRVLRVVKTAAAAIEPHPVVHASELDEAVRGVFRVNNALTILLDLEKLLTPKALSV
ncbi:MAG TPA: chemotaxis protein CheW [Thermoanaerobaculia bacterium]